MRFAGDASKPASMGRKNDFIVWLRLKPMQRKVYEVSQVIAQWCSGVAQETRVMQVMAFCSLQRRLSACGRKGCFYQQGAQHASTPICLLPGRPQAFLNSDAVKAVFNQTNSALSALTVLKKICDHPALLSKRAEKGIVSGGAWRGARRLMLLLA